MTNPVNICALAAIGLVDNILIDLAFHPTGKQSGRIFLFTVVAGFAILFVRYLMIDVLIDHEANVLVIRNPLRRYVVPFDDLDSMSIVAYKPVSLLGSRTYGVVAVQRRRGGTATQSIKVFATLNNIDDDPLVRELHTVARHAFVEFDDRLPEALW